MTVEEYLKALEPYTPRMSRSSPASPRTRSELMADLMADPKQNVLSWWCMGMNQHTRGTAINSLVHAIHHLSGQWGRPGRRPSQPDRPALRLRHLRARSGPSPTCCRVTFP
ncbi:MAG: hypothetical protein U1F77_06885 [Kiritimatiellia bacterium]